MPQIQIKARYLKIFFLSVSLILIAVLAFSGVYIWEKGRHQQAVSNQIQQPSSSTTISEEQVVVDGVSYIPKKNLQTMLFIGLDKMDPFEASNSYNNDTQADFFLLAVFDTENESVAFLHINRDTMSEIPVLGVTGQPAGTIFGQLALSYTYGDGLTDSCRNSVKAVSSLLLNTQIDHYIGLRMGAIPYINDLVGGDEVTVLDDFSTIDDSLVQGETVILQGDQALRYVRTRKGLEDSTNLSRMERQRQYLLSFAQQVTSLQEDLSFSPELVAQILQYVLSDCSVETLSTMMHRFSDYSIGDIQDIAGEAKQGEEFMEYYVDQQDLQQKILTLFYEKVEDYATEEDSHE